MVRLLRLTMRLGLSLAAGGIVSGLLHGGDVPDQHDADPSRPATLVSNSPVSAPPVGAETNSNPAHFDVQHGMHPRHRHPCCQTCRAQPSHPRHRALRTCGN